MSQLVSGKCGTHGTVKRDKPPGLYVNCNPHPHRPHPFAEARLGLVGVLGIMVADVAVPPSRDLQGNTRLVVSAV